MHAVWRKKVYVGRRKVRSSPLQSPSLTICNMATISNSSSDDDLAIAALILQRRKRKGIWAHDTNKKRKDLGEHHLLAREVSLDGEGFKDCVMFSRELFRDLMGIVGPAISKQGTNIMESISKPQWKMKTTPCGRLYWFTCTVIKVTWRIYNATHPVWTSLNTDIL